MRTATSRDDTLCDRLTSAWMSWAGRQTRFVFIGLGVVVVLSVFGTMRLGVDADSSRMLSPDLPAQATAARINRLFPDLKSSLVIVVRSDRSDAADIAAIRLVEGLKQETRWIRHVYAPAADPFMNTNGFLYLEPEAVDQVMTRLSASSNLLARLRSDQTIDGFFKAIEEAAGLAERANLGPESLDRLYEETASVIRGQLDGEPVGFSWSALMNDDSIGKRSTRLITVTPQLDRHRISPAKPALEAIRRVVDALPTEISASVTIGVTGEPALRADEMDSVLGTIAYSLAASLVLVAAILWIGLRSVGRAALAFGSLILTLIVTTGLAGFLVGNLNLVSVAFVVLMVGLGIDFAIHVIAHMTELRAHGTPPDQAGKLTGLRAGLALCLSAATTALGFLAFTVTDFDGMAQLGLIGGVGVIVAFVVAITLIPAAVSLWPWLIGDARPAPASRQRWTASIPASLPVIFVLAVGLAALVPATQVRFDADPMSLRDPASPSVQAFQLLASQAETTPYRASVLAAGGAAEAGEIVAMFRNKAEIAGAISFSSLIPDEQDEKLTLLDIAAPSIEHAVTGPPDDLGAAQATADDRLNVLRARLADQEDRQRGAEALFRALEAYGIGRDAVSDRRLEQQLYRSFPLMLDRLDSMLMADYVTGDAIPDSLRDRFVAPDGSHRIEILPSDDLTDATALSSFVAAVETVRPDAGGGPVQMYYAGQTIGGAMVTATLLAALATGMLAWLATRSVRDVAAILLPLVVAGVITAGASVALGMPFNYANVIVLPLLIGIGVDSGVHVAMRERRAPGAVFETSTPRAVVFSALTTIAAFGTLAISDHRGTASMGLLLAIAVGAAVLSILALTPAIMRWTNARYPA